MPPYAPVAQLDRAPAYEAGCWRFDPSQEFYEWLDENLTTLRLWLSQAKPIASKSLSVVDVSRSITCHTVMQVG